jgi:hypothetical protein
LHTDLGKNLEKTDSGLLVHRDVLCVPGFDELARTSVAFRLGAGAARGEVDVGATACHRHVLADVKAAQIRPVIAVDVMRGVAGRVAGCVAFLTVHGCSTPWSVGSAAVIASLD